MKATLRSICLNMIHGFNRRAAQAAALCDRLNENGIDHIVMLGDAQTEMEPGVRPDQIIAIVTRVTRKGKDLHPGTFWWDFFESAWLRLLPLRRTIHKLYSIIKPPK